MRNNKRKKEALLIRVYNVFQFAASLAWLGAGIQWLLSLTLCGLFILELFSRPLMASAITMDKVFQFFLLSFTFNLESGIFQKSP